MTEQGEQPYRLVQALERMAREEDRAALATLRASLRPDRRFEGLRIVLPHLGTNVSASAEEDALLVAGLFALHPQSGRLSLATALRIVAGKTGSESVEQRFAALLGENRSDLDTHLRHAVSLVRSHEIPINWGNLYWAVRRWNAPDDDAYSCPKRCWARDFWAPVDQPANVDAKTVEGKETSS